MEREYIYARTAPGCIVGLVGFLVAVSAAALAGTLLRNWWLVWAVLLVFCLPLVPLVRRVDQRARRKSAASHQEPRDSR